MKTTSKYILEGVSKNCSNQLKLYQFNKNTLIISEKYREGRLIGLKYIGDLTFYFMQEEKRIQIIVSRRDREADEVIFLSRRYRVQTGSL